MRILYYLASAFHSLFSSLLLKMFTKRVLSEIRDSELKQRLSSKEGRESRLEWIKDAIDKFGTRGTVDVSGSLQQTDLLREFYLSIAEKGLRYAYDHANQYVKPRDLPRSMTFSPNVKKVVDNSDKHVLIVGAGISGLVAAYELAKEKYNVEILEMSQRFGGRVKTLTQEDGFDRGLHTDGEQSIPTHYWY